MALLEAVWWTVVLLAARLRWASGQSLLGPQPALQNNINEPPFFYFQPFDGAKNWARNMTERYLRYTDRAESRKQPLLPKSFKFPCDKTSGRSRSRPMSVHRLRPGDIDVVAAMGDSLIAGNGAMDDYALGTFIEYRGVSWCAGGDGSWREYLTLPNILKEFNPDLVGFSQGSAPFPSPRSALNMAFPVSSDQDAYAQAKQLVYRMKHRKDIDFDNHWKLVTIFFGANDLCSTQCYNWEMATPAAHSRKLQLALDYLQKNMPRTLVNLIPVIDVSVSVRLKRSFMCKMLHRLFCTCFHQSGDVMTVITALARKYQHAEATLINSGRYNKKLDFTVVLQPFMAMFNAPTEPSMRNREAIDISYITHDCFHFSQKGHALAANLLWNNMLEPVGQKSLQKVNYLMEKFYCPTERAPFVFTFNNSMRFYLTGSQL